MKKDNILIAFLLCTMAGIFVVSHPHSEQAESGGKTDGETAGIMEEQSGCDIRSYFDCVTDSVKEKIKAYEGLRLRTYMDSHGRMTIGYGHVQGKQRMQTITKEQADRLFEQDLAIVAHYINGLEICHTQNEFDALVCFVYNIGITQFSNSDLKMALEWYGSPKQIREEFLRWVYSDGRICQGLVTRRKWESDMFLAYA